MPSDELDVLHTVVSRLDRAGFHYMLSGSIALAAYATPRMTRDLDLVVQLETSDVDRFVQLFAEDFYVDADAVRRSVTSRSIVNMIDLTRVVKVDIIVRKDTAYRRLEFERRRRTAVDGNEIWIVSPEDLVLSKLVWAREGESALQMGDVRELLSSVPDLDWTYLDRWAGQLAVTALLAEARP
jgi:hypothetical protein